MAFDVDLGERWHAVISEQLPEPDRLHCYGRRLRVPLRRRRLTERAPLRVVRDPEGHLAGGAGDPDVLDYQSAGAHLLVESRACDRAQRRIRLHRYDVKPAMEVVGGVVAVVHTDVEYFLHQGPLRMHLRL